MDISSGEALVSMDTSSDPVRKTTFTAFSQYTVSISQNILSSLEAMTGTHQFESYFHKIKRDCISFHQFPG